MQIFHLKRLQTSGTKQVKAALAMFKEDWCLVFGWTCVYMLICMSWYVCVDKCMFMCVFISACSCVCVCVEVCACSCVCIHVEARDQPWMLLLRSCHLGVYLLFRLVYFYLIYISMCLHICVHHVYAWCLRRSEEGLNPVGTGVVDGG